MPVLLTVHQQPCFCKSEDGNFSSLKGGLEHLRTSAQDLWLCPGGFAVVPGFGLSIPCAAM